MWTLDRILLATDFSESAENAAQIAAGVAAGTQAELHILTVQLVYAAMAHDMRRAIYAESEIQLDNYEVGVGLRTVKAIKSGGSAGAAPVIVDYAREHDIDLIAIGSHSRPGLARFFLGSVAAEVVRIAPTSVLVAGPGRATAPDDYKCIVAPVDFSDQSLAALREAATIAEVHKARLVVPHVVDTSVLPLFSQSNAEHVSEGARKALAGLVETADVPVPVEPVVTVGSVHTEIAKLAEEREADLIVIGASGLGAVERFLLGSATNRVLRMAPCPVLVYRDKEPPKP